jgi:hypothetical protein
MKACDSALRMTEQLDALNEFLEEDARRQNLSYVPLSASIGIDSGGGIMGNIGATQGFDFGVTGEPVTFASYLQRHARDYGPAKRPCWLCICVARSRSHLNTAPLQRPRCLRIARRFNRACKSKIPSARQWTKRILCRLQRPKLD